jgi:hypothetical protein
VTSAGFSTMFFTELIFMVIRSASIAPTPMDEPQRPHTRITAAQQPLAHTGPYRPVVHTLHSGPLYTIAPRPPFPLPLLPLSSAPCITEVSPAHAPRPVRS